MTPQEILDRLKGIGLIDPVILEKIRLHVEDPKKVVKPKAILSYLVKKEQITRAQASALLKEIEAPKPIKHEEIEVTVPSENAYDTDDLTSTVREVVAPKVDPQRTMEAVPVDDDDDAPVDIVPVKPMHPTREVDPVVDMVDPLAVPHAPVPDPLEAGPLDQAYGEGFDEQFYGEQQPAETKKKFGFQGKRLKKDQWATKWLYIGFGILGS